MGTFILQFVLFDFLFFNHKSLILYILYCGSYFFIRLRFLGKVLLVERANKQTEDNKQKSEALHGKDLATPTSLTKDFTRARDLSEGLNSSSLPSIEPIAAKLGVDYPFPPHLEYVFLFTIFSIYFFLPPLTCETGL